MALASATPHPKLRRLRFHGVPEEVNGRRPLLAHSGLFEQARRMSTSGGKADIPDTPYQCPLMTQSGHAPCRPAPKSAAIDLGQSNSSRSSAVSRSTLLVAGYRLAQ